MEFNLIKTETEYTLALHRLEEIFDPEIGTPEAEEAEILTLLIKNYEEKTYPITAPSLIEYVKYYMETNGMKARDLVGTIGNESYVSQFLSNKKPLTLRIAKNLYKKLNIPAELLLT